MATIEDGQRSRKLSKKSVLTGLATLVVLALLGGMAYFAISVKRDLTALQANQAATAPAPASVKKPINTAATVLVTSVWKEKKSDGGFIFGPPTDPYFLEFQSPCSGAAVARTDNAVEHAVYFVTAQHCIDNDEVGKPQIEQDYNEQKADRDKNKPKGSTPSDSDASKDDKEKQEFNPELTVYVYQPASIPGRYIVSPQPATLVSSRKMTNGNDTAILKLNLSDPNTVTPVLPLATHKVADEAHLRSVGYPGDHIPNLEEAMFPARHHLKKGVLDIIQTEALAPTITDGIAGGTQRISNAGVTETNADFGGGMSGGAVVNDDSEYSGTIQGGYLKFFDVGGNFNFISQDMALLRSDLVAAGALPALTTPADTTAINAAVAEALAKQDTKNDTFFEFLTAVLVVALCLALLLANSFRRKNDTTSIDETNSATADDDSEVEDAVASDDDTPAPSSVDKQNVTLHNDDVINENLARDWKHSDIPSQNHQSQPQSESVS